MHFAFTGDNSNFMNALNGVTSGVRGAMSQIEQSGMSIDQFFQRLQGRALGALGSMGIAMGAEGFVRQAANIRGEFQKLEVAFNTMLGSEQKATELMQQLVSTAATTPFDLQGVANGAKQLLAYGTSVEHVNDMIVRLGDIAAGMSIPLNDLVMLYGTTMTQGRMFTQDLRQFQGRGIPLAEALAKQFGVAKSEIGDLVTAGRVGAKEFHAAIMEMTDPGGQFGGLMAAQSKTISGQMSNIQDAISSMFNEIGRAGEPVINWSLEMTSTLVEHWQEVGAAIAAAVAAFGTQKAAEMTIGAYQSAKGNLEYAEEISQLETLLAQKEAEEKTDLDLAVAEGRLSASKAEMIAAMRAEAQARVEALTIKAQEAAIEEQAAAAALTRAQEEQSIASELVEAAQEKYEAASDANDVLGMQAAYEDWLTASEMENTAATATNTAEQNLATASSARQTAALQAETAATTLNSASEVAAAKTTGILTMAKNACTAAANKLKVAIMSNPYMLAAAAVMALAYGIYKLVTYQTEAEKAQQKVNEAMNDSIAAGQAEKEQLDSLFDTLKNNREETDAYQQAKQSIIDQYGQYLNGLIDEKNNIIDLEAAYNRLTLAIRNKALEEGMAKARKAADDTYAEAIKDPNEKIVKQLEKLTNLDQRAALRNLIDTDLQEIGGLSSDTETAIYKAFGINRKDRNDADVVHRIRNAAKEIREASFIHSQSIAEVEANYGRVSDNYTNLTADELRSRGQAIQAALDEADAVGETADIIVTANGQITDSFKSREMALVALNQISSHLRDKEQEEANKSVNSAANKLKDAEKKYNESKAAWERLMKSPNASDQEINEAYTNYKAALDTYNNKREYHGLSKIDNKSGKSNAPAEQEKARQDYISLIDQQSRERLRAAEDAEITERQARINLMDESGEKVREQMRLNHDKEIKELQRQREDAAVAEINRQREAFNAEQKKQTTGKKNAKEEVFTSANVDQSAIDTVTATFDRQMEILHQRQEKEREEALQSELASMYDYLSQYGTFQEKKLATARKYAAQIAKEGDPYKRQSLERQRDTELNQIEVDAAMQNIDWGAAFGNLTGVLEETVKSTLDGLQAYTKTDKFKAAPDTDKKVVYEAIERLKEYLPEERPKGTLNFAALNKEMKALGEQVKKTQTAFNEMSVAKANLAAAEENLLKAKSGGDESAIEAAQQTVDQWKEKVAETTETFDNLNNEVQETAKVLSDKFKGTIEGLNGIASGLSKLSSGSLATAFQGLQETTASLGQVMKGKLGGAISSFAEKIGSAGFIGQLVSAILSILDILKDGIGTLIGGLIDTIFNAVSGLLKTIVNGQAFVQIGKSLVNGLGGLLNAITAGGWNALWRGNSKEISEITDKLTARNETLISSLDNLRNSIDKAYGMQVVENAEKAKALQEEIVENKRQILEANQRYHGKHRTNNHYITASMTDEDWALANSILATERAGKRPLSEASHLWTLTPEELQKLMANPYLAEKIKGGKYNKDELIDDYISEAGKLEEITRQMKESLTQISFDSMFDSFVSSLMDMEKSAEDFSKDFSKMMMQAVLTAKVGDLYQGRLKEWYDQFAASMEDDGTLDEDELAALRSGYQGIVDDALKTRDELAKVTGYDSDTYSQEASRASWESLGEDTGQELVGRFTAMQIANESMAAGMVAAVNAITSVSAIAETANSTLANILIQQVLAVAHLEDIAIYSKQLVAVEAHLRKMNSYLSNL